MKRSFILLVDALINLALGTILVMYTIEISQILGIPETTPGIDYFMGIGFYPDHNQRYRVNNALSKEIEG